MTYHIDPSHISFKGADLSCFQLFFFMVAAHICGALSLKVGSRLWEESHLLTGLDSTPPFRSGGSESPPFQRSARHGREQASPPHTPQGPPGSYRHKRGSPGFSPKRRGHWTKHGGHWQKRVGGEPRSNHTIPPRWSSPGRIRPNRLPNPTYEPLRGPFHPSTHPPYHPDRRLQHPQPRRRLQHPPLWGAPINGIPAGYSHISCLSN